MGVDRLRALRKPTLRTIFTLLSLPSVVMIALLLPSAYVSFHAANSHVAATREDVAAALAADRVRRASELFIWEMSAAVVAERADVEDIRATRKSTLSALTAWSLADPSTKNATRITTLRAAFTHVDAVSVRVVSLVNANDARGASEIFWRTLRPAYDRTMGASLRDAVGETHAPLNTDALRLAGSASSNSGLTAGFVMAHVVKAQETHERAEAADSLQAAMFAENQALVEYLLARDADTNAVSSQADDVAHKLKMWSAAVQRDRSSHEKQAHVALVTARRARLRTFSEGVIELMKRGDIGAARALFAGRYEPSFDALAAALEHSVARDENDLFAETAAAVTFTRGLEVASLAFASVFAIAVLIGLVVLARVTGALRHLTAAARAIGDGKLATRVSVDRQDEIGDLGRAFNAMIADLAAAQERADRLFGQTVDASERERQQIAADLHDGPVQGFTGILYAIERVGLRCARGDLEGAQSLVRDLSANVSAEIASLRHTMTELRPPALDERGVTAAIADYVVAFQARVGVDCKVSCNLERRPPGSIETVIYRIVQECLSNAERHSRASHVRISLCEEESVISLRVEDDGVGFDLEDDLGSSHFGLASMRERVRSAGGTFDLGSTLGRGTSVVVTIPIAHGVAA